MRLGRAAHPLPGAARRARLCRAAGCARGRRRRFLRRGWPQRCRVAPSSGAVRHARGLLPGHGPLRQVDGHAGALPARAGGGARRLRARRGLDLRAKLGRVNAAVNGHPYVPSQRNWGESNHWETPFEFLRKSGQCQDYAVAKYLLLRAAGVPAEQLRVLVLRDTRLGLDHAVAVAYVEGEAFLLDNRIGAVVPADSVHHYQPYYSINEEGWWLHVGPNARYASAADGALR